MSGRGTGRATGHVPMAGSEAPAAEPAAATLPMPRGVKFGRGAGYAALSVVVAVIASLGQVESARKLHFVNMIVLWGWDLTPYLAPAVFDLTVIALFNGGLYVLYKGLNPWPYWIAAFGVGGLSVYVNTQHVGWEINTGASVALMILSFLALYYRYVEIQIKLHRRRAAGPKFLMSSLVQVAPRTAWHARNISIQKPLAKRVRELAALGEETTERDLAIGLAGLFISILDDREVEELKETKLWQSKARRLARRKARLTAWDEVDRRLGLPVPVRTGIPISRVSFTETDPDPVKPRKRPETEDRDDRRDERKPDGRREERRDERKPDEDTDLPEVPESWITDKHKARIEGVIKALGAGWERAPKAPPVRRVEAIGKEYPDLNMRNSDVVREVAKCIKVVRARLIATASKSN